MLYKKNCAEKLDIDLFRNPTAEYRGTPFWAWNADLKADELCRQIDVFREMGLGGFHMHVRTGLENEYLSDEFMQLVKTCVEKAKANEMLAWLYDEDRWPSGAAGGFVTKDVEYRGRRYVFSHDYDKTVARNDEQKGENEPDNGLEYITAYDIILDDNGYLISYDQISKNDAVQGEKWYLFTERLHDESWHNTQAYIDTLNPDAIRRFIEVTHEAYKREVGDEFDRTIPAIFTDEPQVVRKQVLNNSFDTDRDIMLPATPTFAERYEKKYGKNLFDVFPECVWELPKGIHSPYRYYYHDLVSEMFTNAFADQIGAWCEENNIALTGHMMEEPTLRSQTAALSETMRSYRGFQIPGIDLLCNNYEYTTAKQCQSAVRQYNREAMLSELYGVTSWDADFRLYKFSGDWQAALGVTVRVPHLSWYAMQGEAKRDYPASISYQSPWYKKYSLVEDHFARLNTALTRGKPVVKVAVIHPIESYWLHWGPNDKTEVLRQAMDNRFLETCDWLINGAIDFDYISESLIPELVENPSFPLKVGEMEYDAVLVSGSVTLRQTTLDMLKGFANAGGKVVFMGNAPSMVNALPSNEAKDFAKTCVNIEYNQAALLDVFEDNRTISLKSTSGKPTDNFIYQMRDDGEVRWIFICRSKEPRNKDIEGLYDVIATIKGEYKIEHWNTENGKIQSLDVSYKNGDTVVTLPTYPYTSFLLHCTKGKMETKNNNQYPDMFDAKPVECTGFVAHEDNVLLLDKAEWRLDGGNWHRAEEILRLDNIARKKLGYDLRGAGIVQPWAQKKIPAEHTISLRFRFESDIEYNNPTLALEDREKAMIRFNGIEAIEDINEYFVDKAIRKVQLSAIKRGENVLEITWPFGANTNAENVFILGNFGVQVAGTSAKIIAKPEKIYFGDLVNQGYPFYGGAFTYKFKAKAAKGKLAIKSSHYRGAVQSVRIDGEEVGNIIYPPYILMVDNLDETMHDVEITLWPHRYNTFGPLHLVDVLERWHGPGAWRSSGDNWSYEYVLRPVGIMSAPRVK
jgi:hypothetical protein